MSSGDDKVRSVYDETTGNKTFRKFKENPMVPIGMAGFFAAVAFGVMNYKKRPKNMSLSMYIMRFRVFAQSIAVGAMGVGILYTIMSGGSSNKSPQQTSTAGGHVKR